MPALETHASLRRDADSSQVRKTLDRLREMDPRLAAKVAPATQLALLEDAKDQAPLEHVWRYLGHAKDGTLYDCARCPVTMRTTRRFRNALTTFSVDGKRYSKNRPPCAMPPKRGS